MRTTRGDPEQALATLRAAFPVAEEWIYFNHAAVAPLPQPAADAVGSFLQQATRHGSTGFASWLERREKVRALAAELLSAHTSEIGFTTSTSQGLLLVAEGLDLRPGDQIVVAENDFPANQIPWFRQRRRGADVVSVSRREGRLLVADLLAALTPRTRLLAVPWVFYDNGFRLDLSALGAALAAHNARHTGGSSGRPPVLLCVDAIQGLGAFPLDVHACGIDFLAADSHKWLLGIEGLGLFYCRKELVESLDPPFISWWSMARPFAPWHPEAPLADGARRWEYACLPTLSLYGLHASLELILEAGLDTIERRVLELTAALAAGLTARGWTLHTPMASTAERSGIVTASHPSLHAHEAVARLEAARVSVSPRGAGVRFSPHGWNTLGEVQRLLERLP